MLEKSHYSSTFYLQAVEISAQLNTVLIEANNISLEAMNAKALVARAGDNVRTFKPITDFMVSLADETIELVNIINDEADIVARISLDGLRDFETLKQFNQVENSASDAKYISSLKDAKLRNSTELDELDSLILKKTRKLQQYLEDIEQRMLAVQVTTSTSRLEAARVSDLYRQNFETIVFKFEEASKKIRRIVIYCRKILANHMLEFSGVEYRL